ncbi:hypothetical protein NZ698_00600 [Chryseobacterium sp. PBS4-4]|uniref:Uncharacterized protein n=1 Tax=Chryseobacterium edaphi TaxID=2976532 RepID=A0ABT2W4M1_9FLAO|nr:hypothetical protein [Chryseobacterium edaphi]MCU7615680.1 hypothetical protein [Chryseobacterium edaphi]
MKKNVVNFQIKGKNVTKESWFRTLNDKAEKIANKTEWKMNIKYLTDYLMNYVSAMEENNTQETERLMTEIAPIFDKLHSNTSEETKKQEIINLILLKMQEKTLNHLDVATYTRELVVYGFQ